MFNILRGLFPRRQKPGGFMKAQVEDLQNQLKTKNGIIQRLEEEIKTLLSHRFQEKNEVEELQAAFSFSFFPPFFPALLNRSTLQKQWRRYYLLCCALSFACVMYYTTLTACDESLTSRAPEVQSGVWTPGSFFFFLTASHTSS